MKRLAISIFIFTFGAACLCGLRSATAIARQETASLRDAWLTLTQSVTRASNERTELEARVRELRQRLAALSANPLRSRLASLIPRDGKDMTPDQREQLLAEFGFDWNSTGEFLVVSKQTLQNVGFDAVKGNKLTDVVCGVLALTPDERATVEATMAQVASDYQSWAKVHVQREEPAGDVVAKYTMPPDTAISQSLSNSFVNGIFVTLGRERAELLENYSREWMVALGMNQIGLAQSDTTMTVKRYGTGDKSRLNVEVNQAGGRMSTDVSPWQPFPEAFKPLFPNGWKDLAAREGFELPAEFKKQTTH
jgi:hypothetical protein